MSPHGPELGENGHWAVAPGDHVSWCHQGEYFHRKFGRKLRIELNFEQKTALEFVNVDHLISNGSLNRECAASNGQLSAVEVQLQI